MRRPRRSRARHRPGRPAGGALWNLLAAKFVNDTTPPAGGIRILPALTDASAVSVSWAATDVGSGVASYSVQVRDLSSASWTAWLTGSTATSGHYVGVPGHTYEFRVSATDFKGNQQPWLASSPVPGSALTVGGFGRVLTDTLNVRSGAGTSFSAIDQLAGDALVAILGGPIDAGGYTWYQVQFDFAEWPSSDYPRLGWVAGGTSGTPYVASAAAPNMTTLSPSVTGYAAAPRTISPNGDGVLDGTTASFSLPRAATNVRLDVLSSAGQVVRSIDLGPLGAGAQTVAWDGRVTSGSWAAAGSYLLRITATDALGSHVAPVFGVDGGVLAKWGVSVDLIGPTAASMSPMGTGVPMTVAVTATFSEAVLGVGSSSFKLIDTSTGTSVAGSVAYDAATRRATFTPSAALAAARTYRATLEPSVRDGAGNALQRTTWTFTTAPAATTYDPPAALVFKVGTHTGYQFSSSGAVTATKSASLSRDSGANTSTRSTIANQSGNWFLVTNGIWAGYWLRESSMLFLAPPPPTSTATLPNATYSPAVSLVFKMGTHTGYKFNSSGALTATKSYTLPKDSGASTSKRTTIANQSGSWYYVTNGVWAGYWLRASEILFLR